METINATDLARSTREILDKVIGHRASISVERNQMLVAKIVPADVTMTARQALTGLVANTLSPEQANAWLHESRGDFDDALRDPWANN